MRIALTGGTGLVGTFITDHLLAAGHDLTLMVRPGTDAALVPPGVAVVTGTLSAPADLSWLAGQDALVHAAFAHAPGRYRGGEGEDLAGFLDANLTGSLRLMATAQKAGVGRCILLSSRAVYGSRVPGRALDEDHPATPASHYGALKASLEAFGGSLWLQDGWPVAALRPTGIYGIARPFARTKWLDLVQAVIDGADALPVRRSSEVHGEDVARAVELLLTADRAAIGGQAFNCGDLMVSTRDIATIVQATTGSSGPLPEERIDPLFLEMECGRLRRLGLVFGGRRRLESTIAAICARLRPG